MTSLATLSERKKRITVMILGLSEKKLWIGALFLSHLCRSHNVAKQGNEALDWGQGR